MTDRRLDPFQQIVSRLYGPRAGHEHVHRDEPVPPGLAGLRAVEAHLCRLEPVQNGSYSRQLRLTKGLVQQRPHGLGDQPAASDQKPNPQLTAARTSRHHVPPGAEDEVHEALTRAASARVTRSRSVGDHRCGRGLSYRAQPMVAPTNWPMPKVTAIASAPPTTRRRMARPTPAEPSFALV